jgi:predicted phage terminase large subunit-like protein
MTATIDHQAMIAHELARRELARRSTHHFAALFDPNFVSSPFHLDFCKRLDRFLDDFEGNHQPCCIISAPPRHGKSICVRSMLARALGRNPRTEIMFTTYNQDFADDNGLLFRDLITTPLYQDLYPNVVLREDSAAKDNLITAHGGGARFVGVGGAITGRGGNILVVDDPIKNADQAASPGEMEKQIRWYVSTLRSRAMPIYGILVVMTRWSMSDLAGHLLRTAAADPKADQFQNLVYPLVAKDRDLLSRRPGEELHPERWGAGYTNKLRANCSPREWSSLYQQEPVPESGVFFDLPELERCIVPPAKAPPVSDLAIYIPGDFAIGKLASNDFTVFWPFGVDAADVAWFLPDVVRGRFTPFEMIEKLLDLADRLHPRELILEDGHIYRGLRDTLLQRMRERGHQHYITAPYPTKDKGARATPLRARIQQGKVRFIDSPFVRDVFIPEAAAFLSDTTVHDDTVDAAAMGMNRLTRLRGARAAPPPADTGPRLSSDPDNWTMDDIIARRREPRRAPAATGRNPFLRIPRRLNGRER